MTGSGTRYFTTCLTLRWQIMYCLVRGVAPLYACWYISSGRVVPLRGASPEWDAGFHLGDYSTTPRLPDALLIRSSYTPPRAAKDRSTASQYLAFVHELAILRNVRVKCRSRETTGYGWGTHLYQKLDFVEPELNIRSQVSSIQNRCKNTVHCQRQLDMRIRAWRAPRH